MSNATVSIYVPTYNHERYIVQALDSIRMQQTQYSYQVYVGEDCSTDGTRQVLQQWEAQHADPRFHIFYRPENMHGQSINNANDLRSRCKGKYLICLEGDDYWTDPLKLQTQVDFLESHPEYYAVAHNCTVVDRDSQPKQETYPECKDTEYTLRHFASDILPGQYTTLLTRNYLTDPDFDTSLIDATGGPGDRRVYFSIAAQSKIYCIQKVMSAYRHVTDGGSSFSATSCYAYGSQEQYQRKFLKFACRIGTPLAMDCAQMLYLRNIRFALRKGYVDKAQASLDKKNLPQPLRAAALVCKRDINYRIFHRTMHI